MKVSIDQGSGFCPGVVKAIRKAEEVLGEGNNLSCLGQIVHNEEEVRRLEELGMDTLDELSGPAHKSSSVLIRAHGEPPSTYRELKSMKAEVIDATCPIVKRLQKKVMAASEELKESNGIVIIFGKERHPEVRGLLGNAKSNAMATRDVTSMDKSLFSKPFEVFSQTTMDPEAYAQFCSQVEEYARAVNNSSYRFHDSICGFVKGRKQGLQNFAASVDLLLFLSGKNSSNGRFLYEVARDVNPSSVMIHSVDEISREMLTGKEHVGISGATSTPGWLMEKAANRVKELMA